MNYRFEPMTEALLGPVCGAFRQVFAAVRTPATWRHIYHDAPDGSLSVVALDEANDVAGFFGGTLHRVSGPGEGGSLYAQMRDVFTRPSARSVGKGRGSLFASLGRVFVNRAAGAGVSTLFGFGSERHVRLGERLLGYGPLTGLQMWEMAVPATVAFPVARQGALSVIQHFDADMSALARKHVRPDAAIVVRDEAFLNWRFSHRSGRVYTCCRYDSAFAGGVAGYAVIAVEGMHARLVDFLLPHDPELRADMWRQLIARLGALGTRRLTLLASLATPEADWLVSLGCSQVEAPQPWRPACMSLVPGGCTDDLGKSFHMTMADGDIF